MATDGREVIGPGQVIASDWGNKVWDQSVQTFDSSSDRATQYPAPHNGSVTWRDDVKRLEVYYESNHHYVAPFVTTATGLRIRDIREMHIEDLIVNCNSSGQFAVDFSASFGVIHHVGVIKIGEPVAFGVVTHAVNAYTWVVRDLNAVFVVGDITVDMHVVGEP